MEHRSKRGVLRNNTRGFGAVLSSLPLPAYTYCVGSTRCGGSLFTSIVSEFERCEKEIAEARTRLSRIEKD
jgi:hypothetical protein